MSLSRLSAGMYAVADLVADAIVGEAPKENSSPAPQRPVAATKPSPQKPAAAPKAKRSSPPAAAPKPKAIKKDKTRVKVEALRSMPRRGEKVNYNEAHLQTLAWSGTGTRADPIRF